MRYIHELKNWPQFTWDKDKISSLLGPIRNRLGRLTGRMEALGFSLRSEAVLQTLTMDVLKSSEIEGEILERDEVRSSIARKLGMNIAGLVPSDRHVDGVVDTMLDAIQNFSKPLTKSRLLGWQNTFFPTGRSGMHKIIAGAWRNDRHGPMQVVSGPLGREKAHFKAPDASRIESEIKDFLSWFNKSNHIDPVLKAGIAHFWFVTVHPFEDGNGRLARAITDMQLARADDSKQRFYSMSVQIRLERNTYYVILEKTQKNADLDITAWLEWFLSCLDRALSTTEQTLADVFKKAAFWETHRTSSFNDRQRRMINKLFDGFEGKLTSTKWAKMTKTSHDTALRDISELLDKKILTKDDAGGRSTSYQLKL